MQLPGKLRLAAYIAPPLATFVIAVVSCVDLSAPVARNDEFAEMAFVSLQMRSKITVFTGGAPHEQDSFSQTLALRVLPGPASSRFDAKAGTHNSHEGRTVVRHFKDESGKVRSIGFYFDRPDRPPKFVYAFEDGRIQSIVGAEYERRGKGFIRTRSRITLFGPDGKPMRQIAVAPEQSAAFGISEKAASFNAGAAQANQDISRIDLPRMNYFDDGSIVGSEETGCLQQYLNYFAAIAALAVANALLDVSLGGCAAVGVPCLALPVAIAGVAAAVAAWNRALDELKACEDAKAPGTGAGGGSGVPGTVPSSPDGTAPPSTAKTVNQFISDSIDSGSFWCSSTGDYCVYYAT